MEIVGPFSAAPSSTPRASLDIQRQRVDVQEMATHWMLFVIPAVFHGPEPERRTGHVTALIAQPREQGAGSEPRTVDTSASKPSCRCARAAAPISQDLVPSRGSGPSTIIRAEIVDSFPRGVSLPIETSPVGGA